MRVGFQREVDIKMICFTLDSKAIPRTVLVFPFGHFR